jgi:hypothetical protein
MSKWFLTIKLTDKIKDSGKKNSIEIKVQQDLKSCGTFKSCGTPVRFGWWDFFVAKFWLVGIFWEIKIFEGKWLKPFYVRVVFSLGSDLNPTLRRNTKKFINHFNGLRLEFTKLDMKLYSIVY